MAKHTFASPKIVPDFDNVNLNINSFLSDMIQYWIKDYNFYEQEIVFNRFPQFYTIIDGMNFFLYIK